MSALSKLPQPRHGAGRGAASLWLVLTVLVAAAGGVAGWWLWGPVSVQVVRPERGPAVQAVYATGSVEPTVMMPIAPKVAGRLITLQVDEGSMVRKGQVLARLDDTDLERTVDELQARSRFAEEQYRRALAMFERGVGPAVDRDRTRSEWQAAEASAARARAQREFMLLSAPADGQILRRDGEVGQLIPVNQPVFYLSCCESLRIAAAVDEEDIALVEPGQKVLVHADAFPGKRFEARVKEITPMGNPLTRTYRVRLSLPEDVPLRIGMTVDANIIVQEREDALLVPTSAVRHGAVWVVRDGRAHRVAVSVGIEGELKTEIRSGLAVHEALVVAPASSLAEGARVRVSTGSPAS